MKKNIFLLVAVSVVVIASVAVAGIVMYSSTKVEKASTIISVTSPVSVKPELPGQPVESGAVASAPIVPVTKPEEKIMALPMPVAEEAPKEEQAENVPVTAPEEAAIMGEPVLPPRTDNKVVVGLPAFTPITNTTGPVPVTPTKPTTPSADNTDKNPQTKPRDITSFVPQESLTGPVPQGSSNERKDLPPFTPTESPTGPVKND